ncbi:MAG: biotin-dependent carboxyltransferase family protein [Tumebacillaceae bacterium]
MSIEVQKPGLLTTLQDAGRYGYQRHGVLVSGAMDPFALRVANLLVGNRETEAVLEITLQGPVLRFEKETLVAICGASLSPRLDGEAVSEWQAIRVQAGSVLEFGRAEAGCRAYVAVAGGFDVPPVMGSKSTFLRGKLGGFEGRALKAGDILPIGRTLTRRELYGKSAGAFSDEGKGVGSQESGGGFQGIREFRPKKDDSNCRQFVSWKLFPKYAEQPTVRVLRGNQFDAFSAEAQERFFSEPFLVTPQSDRMGYRLQGPELSLSAPLEMISEAVTMGTVQVPPDGNPIVLMADRQTTGGYPKIAQVATVDLPVMAQLKPGDRVRFQEIGLEEAQQLYLQRERDLQILQVGLELARRGSHVSH